MSSTLAFSSTYWTSIGHGSWAIALYALLGLALLILGFLVIDFTTPGPLREEVRAGKPNAVALAAVGFLSVAFIIVVAIWSAHDALLEGLIATTIYGVLGIAAQVIAVRLIEWVLSIDIGALLRNESFDPEVLVVAAAHLAMGLVVAVAIL